MLGLHIANLTGIIGQIQSTVGVAIPEVESAIKQLEAIPTIKTPTDLEQALVAAHDTIKALAGPAQVPPQSLLGQALGLIDRFEVAKRDLLAGRNVTFVTEHISIDGTVYPIATGVWRTDAPATTPTTVSEPTALPEVLAHAA